MTVRPSAPCPLVVRGIDLRVVPPLRGQLVLGKDRVDRTRLHAGVAIDALLRIDEQLLGLFITGLVGRTGDAVKVRGMFVVTRQAEQVIKSFSEVAAFRLTIGRREHRDEITLKLELQDTGIDTAKLADNLNRKFQDACRIKIDNIEFTDQGSIPEDKQGVADERKWE